jgi:hypothetical protein
MKSRVVRWSVAGAVVLGLSGCAEAQQAVDAAQSLVDSASTLVQACESASVAWEPGATVAEATTGIEQASEELSAAVAEGVSIAGAQEVLAALDRALVDLQGVQQDAGISATTAALQSACALVRP